MYSVVLVAVLTSGNATPGWHHCGCHHGGYYGGGYDGFSDGYGCWGGWSSWTPGYAPPPATCVPGGYGLMNAAAVPGTGTGGEELGKPKPNKNGEKESIAPTRAKLVVEVPPDAKMFIDDMPVKATAGVQTFDTPALEPDRLYYYVVRVEAMRDGQPVSETRRIIVRSGQVARADFKELEAVAVKTAQAK